MCITICYITLSFCKSLLLGLFTSLYYYLSYYNCLFLFLITLFICLAYKVALRDLGVLGKSLKACKKNI